MVAGSGPSIISSPGRLVVNPLDLLNQDFPYGGTPVGRANVCALAFEGIPFRVESEILGEATDILESNNRVAFSCFLRGWDDDAVRLFLAGGHSVGDVSQHAGFSVPGNRTPGQSSTSRAVVLLYVPDDLVKAPAVILYRGIPDWNDSASMAFQRGEEMGIPLRVEGLRGANGLTVDIQYLADLPPFPPAP